MIKKIGMFVVTACILVGLFAGFLFLQGQNSQASTDTQAPMTSPPLETKQSEPQDWTSVLMTYRNPDAPGPEKNLVTSLADYRTGTINVFANHGLPEPAGYEEIAPDGRQFLYRTAIGNTTFYQLVSPEVLNGDPSGEPETIFQQPTVEGEDALWERDSRHVLIMSPDKGVTRVDTQTGETTQVLTLPFAGEDRLGSLEILHDGYLYFKGSGSGQCMGALCRVKLDGDHSQVDRLTARNMAQDFWLSPDGKHIYYRNGGPAGEPGIYVIYTDTGTTDPFYQGETGGPKDYFPIGFGTSDEGSAYTLIVMRKLDTRFQVLELLPFTDAPHKVLVEDAAPGAVGICENDNATICTDSVALSPYAHGIMVQGRVRDGSFRVWSTNITTGEQIELPVRSSDDRPIFLHGWSTLAAS